MKSPDRIIRAALRLTARQLRQSGDLLDSPRTVRAYLTLRLAALQHETFGCLFLDHHNRLLADRPLFRGTLTQASVYPREVVREALAVNAAGAIYYHNHPSGKAEPSHADRTLTATLKSALALVDVRSLDHIVIGGTDACSMAERGEI